MRLVSCGSSPVNRTTAVFRVSLSDLNEWYAQYPVAATDDDEPGAPMPPSRSHASEAPVITIAVPQLTHPGESRTNGLAERSVRTVEEQVRTMAAALEAHLLMKIPSEHTILSWLIEHAAYALHTCGPGKDGKTPHALIHCKQTTARTVEFGEKV